MPSEETNGREGAEPLRARPIRSYVLRQGRVSNAQRRACETLLPRYGIAYREHAVVLNAVFGRRASRARIARQAAASIAILRGIGRRAAHRVYERRRSTQQYVRTCVHVWGATGLL